MTIDQFHDRLAALIAECTGHLDPAYVLDVLEDECEVLRGALIRQQMRKEN